MSSNTFRGRRGRARFETGDGSGIGEVMWFAGGIVLLAAVSWFLAFGAADRADRGAFGVQLNTTALEPRP